MKPGFKKKEDRFGTNSIPVSKKNEFQGTESEASRAAPPIFHVHAGIATHKITQPACIEIRAHTIAETIAHMQGDILIHTHTNSYNQPRTHQTTPTHSHTHRHRHKTQTLTTTHIDADNDTHADTIPRTYTYTHIHTRTHTHTHIHVYIYMSIL